METGGTPALSFSLILLCGFALASLGVVFLTLRGISTPWSRSDPTADEEERHHVSFFPPIRQAMAAEDFRFLISQDARVLARRIRRERRVIALAYLTCLRQDFRRLWRLAGVVAGLSPAVGFTQEFARLRLGLAFSVRYQAIRLGFLLGFAPLPELGSLNDVVSKFAMRMETAMKDLGERAAQAAKLTSSLDGRGLDTP